MIKWFIQLIKECYNFIKSKHKTKICKSFCLTCKYWDDCKFIEDIDSIQTSMSDGYTQGYIDGKNS